MRTLDFSLKIAWWEEQFELQGRSPTFWRLSAARLWRAADLAFQASNQAMEEFRRDHEAFNRAEQESGRINIDLDLYKAAYFLYGLALENLLKAALIRDPARFNERGAFDHGLFNYCSDLGLSLTPKQLAIVKELEILVKWRGRYPVPKRKSEWALRKGPYGKNSIPGSLSVDSHNDVLDILRSVRELSISTETNGDEDSEAKPGNAPDQL